MAYSSYATRLSSASSTLKGKRTALTGVNFDSSWEGTAHDSQMEHRTTLDENLGNVITDIGSLVNVLNDLDQYDTLKSQKTKWENEYNSIPTSDRELRREALRNLNEVKVRLADKRTAINSSLDSITTSYSSSLSLLPATEVVNTNEVFAKTFMATSVIEDAFEVSQYVRLARDFNALPDFTNTAAWVTENPYSQCGLYGQCTWFAWGKFYEMYGYDPGFRGNGNMCATQLVNTHPDKFELASTPVAGSVFSYRGYPYGHVGVITEVKDGMITYQDGNYDGVTNSFAVAQTDWRVKTVSLESFLRRYGGNVVFANPITPTYTI